jgi:hypothetical protein
MGFHGGPLRQQESLCSPGAAMISLLKLLCRPPEAPLFVISVVWPLSANGCRIHHSLVLIRSTKLCKIDVCCRKNA